NANVVGGYLFPARGDDLRDREFWQGRSAAHSAAVQGVQLFGYDLTVVADDGSADDWTELLPKGSHDSNEDYRVWDKKIYAMADGRVVCGANDKPTNPTPPADLSPDRSAGGERDNRSSSARDLRLGSGGGERAPGAGREGRRVGGGRGP